MTGRGGRKRKPSAKPKSKAGAAARRARAGNGLVPTKITRKTAKPRREESGPLGWLLPTLESAYAPLTPRGALHPVGRPVTTSSLHTGPGSVVDASPSTWRDLILEYKRRKFSALSPAAAVLAAPAAPMVPGGRNWLPLGPSMVLNGQTVGDQPVSGRVAGLAVAPGGNVIYAATANGGVFVSTDGGTSWRSLMDNFDLDPTSFASASLICGAIAVDPTDLNRVFVGTGEGDTLQLFRSRITNALPAYRGVGVIRTDDGGGTWLTEASSPDLAGEAFFALAVDPRSHDTVLGATTIGLYRRHRNQQGDFVWTREREGVHPSVVATTSANKTRFFCALWDVTGSSSGVFHSDDGGKTWTATGTGFPTANTGRIAVGVQAGDRDLVYAFVATKQGTVHGLYRLNNVGSAWKKVSNVPDVLPVSDGRSQGDYDLAIAVDPGDPNRVYLGGSYANFEPWPGSVWRCVIGTVGAQVKVTNATSIGTHSHADVHVLVHTPNDPNELWCGCDGGVFLNRNPVGDGEFAGHNNGLASLCCNFVGQHPTDPNTLFTGLQDNGTAQTSSGPVWSHVFGGDGGYCVVNWANPKHVLVFANGRVYRSTTGGASGWSPVWQFGWATMTQPIVGLPYNPGSQGQANVVALAAGATVAVSRNFATSWAEQFTIPGGAGAGSVFALAMASPTRVFAGTTTGRVFRANKSASAWSVTRLDDVAGGPLGVQGLITDIAVDWSDATLGSVYVAFGGMGDRRRVWRFDGTRWEARSGLAGVSDLLDVEHNALAVDRLAPNNVYVGADIGVWHSPDSGRNWSPLQNGLPDSPVFDLQIHPTQRLLRAATHGRGLYELPLP